MAAVEAVAAGRNAQFASAVLRRRVDFCFECSEFPCKILEEFSPHVVDRLREIKELGIENWIKRQLA